MQAYRVETAIAADGSLTIKNLPLPIGEVVEVIILVPKVQIAPTAKLSLRGQPVSYLQPFAPVAQDDWESQL